MLIAKEGCNLEIWRESERAVAYGFVLNGKRLRCLLVHASNEWERRGGEYAEWAVWVEELGIDFALGDWNMVRNEAESTSWNRPTQRSADRFNAFIEGSGMVEAEFEGEQMTWMGKGVSRKLDRILLTRVGGRSCDLLSAVSEEAGVFDHLALRVWPVGRKARKVPRNFRYFNSLSVMGGYAKVVEKVWGEDVGGCVGLVAILETKLGAVRRGLIAWTKGQWRVNRATRRQLLEEVERNRSLLRHRGGERPRAALKKAVAEWRIYLKAQKLRMEQQHRQNWLLEGEDSTRYFHMLQRKRGEARKVLSI